MSFVSQVANDIENIQGVTDVRVEQVNGVLEVDVVLDTMEFPLFEKVIQKELDLYDQFPDMPVRFNVALMYILQAAEAHAGGH